MADEEFTFGAKAVAQIGALVRAEFARLQNPDAGHRRQAPANESESLQGFLEDDLDAATDEKTGATTATLNVWYRDPVDGDLLDAERTIVVTNRDTGFSAAADSYLKVYWLEGEWRPIPTGGAASGTVVAKLAEDMCGGFCGPNIECIIGTEEEITPLCNPLGQRGVAGDIVLLSKVAWVGTGTECEDPFLPCDPECFDGDELPDPLPEFVWIVVNVQPHCVRVVSDVRTEDNNGGSFLLKCVTDIYTQQCSAQACGEVVAELEPVESPVTPDDSFNPNCDDAETCAASSECCGLCEPLTLLEIEITASTCPALPVGTKVDMAPGGTGWLTPGCILDGALNGAELACSGNGTPEESWALTMFSTNCTATPPCPDAAGDPITLVSAECDPFELVFAVEIEGTAQGHIGYCTPCDPGPNSITLTIRKKAP